MHQVLYNHPLHLGKLTKPLPSTRTKKACRIKRPCPIPECNGSLHANLWNHLFQTHKAQGKYSSELCLLALCLAWKYSSISMHFVRTSIRSHCYLSNSGRVAAVYGGCQTTDPYKRRNAAPLDENNPPANTVKSETDGSVSIQHIEIRPSSAGRERFGLGTKEWGKFPLEDECLQQFLR